MIKEKRILSYFMGWLFLGYIIFVIGTNNVYAASYNGFDYTAKLYDNYNGNLTSVTTAGPTAGTGAYEGYISYNANSSGGAWLISSPITLVANHTYTLTASIPNECGQLVLSSVNRIGVGTIINNAKSSYQNNTDVNEIYSRVIGGDNFLIQFAFTPTINGSYIVFPFATSVTCSSSRTILENIIIDDLGINSATKDQINTSLNNQTNTINNSIQNSTDTITGEINDMEQTIVDSNKETQDVIKDQFNTCRDSYNILNFVKTETIVSGVNITTNNGIITFSGTSTSSGAFNIGTYTLEPGTYYQQSNSTDSFNRYSTIRSISNGSVIRAGNGIITLTETTQVTFQIIFNDQFTGEFTYKPMVNKGTSTLSWEPGGDICSNKIDETNDKLDGIQGALTDSSSPNTSGLENSAGWLPAGPLDSILNLPLTMLNSLTNSLGQSCSPLNLTLPYVNKNIQIPCLSAIFAQITGVNDLWTWVGTIASVLILYNYLLNLYAWVDRVLTLRAEFDEAMGADMANWGRL